MKKINKTETPAFFSDWIRRNNPDQWEDLPPTTRIELREYIWNEQGGGCAYTEVRLPNHNKNCHIDHFKTRNLHRELTFEYTNLLVSCNSEDYGAKHKDKQIKRKENYTQLINPVEENPTDYIEYSFTGKIIAKENSPKAEQTIRYLNLNDKSLVERRKTHIHCLQAYKDSISLDEAIESIGEFETMIRQLYGSL